MFGVSSSCYYIVRDLYNQNLGLKKSFKKKFKEKRNKLMVNMSKK